MRHVVSRKHGPSAQPRRARIVSISSAGTFEKIRGTSSSAPSATMPTTTSVSSQ